MQNLNRGRTTWFTENAQKLMNGDVFGGDLGAHDIINNALVEEVEVGTLAIQWEISTEEMQALRESFEFCDVDGSGSIDQRELISVLKNLGFQPNTNFQRNVFEACLSESSAASPRSVSSSGLVFIRCVQ